AQRRFAAHRHAMGALPAIQTPVFNRAHLCRVSAGKQLVDEAIIVARIIARIDAFEPVPMLGKDLLEDVPVPRGCYKHQGAPSWGVEMMVVQRLYHTSPAQATPSAVCMGHPHSPHCP